MKRLVTVMLISTLLIAALALSITTTAAPTGNTLTVGTGGTYATLDAAIGAAGDGDTLRLLGTVSASAWPAHSGKRVTVTGGTLDLSDMGSTVHFGGSVTFESMTLTTAANATVYANGHKLTVKESVTVTNAVTAIYGGGAPGTTVASTDLTLLSGDYKSIYGGSNKGTVTGDTNVLVGGSVNAACDWTSHSATYNVFGGGNADTIKGDTHMTFTGNAKSNYIWGGSKSAATIKGDKHATMSGGYTMSFYGGNNSHDTGAGSDNYVTVTGGTLQQLFGGNQSAPMTGNVELRVMGGEVTRRIYGGCYNEYASFSWKSAHYVTGNITLIIGGNANVSLTSSDSDRGILAISRHKTRKDTENATIVFADQKAYNAYKNKTGVQDPIGKIAMGSGGAADATHTHSHAASGAVITESCNTCAHTATATLMLTESGPFIYTGEAVTPGVEVVYSAEWLADPLTVSYADNTAPGTGKITAATLDGTSATLTFTIEKRSTAAPTLSAKAETVRGKADGIIHGLNAQMEWRPLNGTDFTPVTDPQMTFAAGTYQVRYAEREMYKASPMTTVTVVAGAPITVTFTADGNVVERRELSWRESIAMEALPTITPKTGHEKTDPYWSVTAEQLTNIEANLTVTAVYTKDQYTVTLPTKQVGYTLTTSTPTPYYGDTVRLTLTLVAGYSKTSEFALCVNGARFTLSNDSYTFTATGDVTVTVVGVADITPPVIEGFGNGGTVYGDLTFTVTEDTAFTVKIDGKVAETHTVTADNATHTVTATDAAGNETTYTVTVCKLYTVTFVANGQTVAVRQVGHGQRLQDVPQIPERAGFTETAPYWNVAVFDTVTGDTTVTAVYTADPVQEDQPTDTPPTEGNGSATQKNENTVSDKTDTAGDENSPALVIVLIAVGGCAVAGGSVAAVMMLRKKKKQG